MSDQKQFHQYFSSRPTIGIVMQNGNRILFTGGQYVTDKEDEIAFLDTEIKAGHPMIFVKKEQLTVSQEQLDPLAAIKKKAIEEYLAKQNEQQDPNRDMGNTTSNISDSISTTRSIQAISAGSKSK